MVNAYQMVLQPYKHFEMPMIKGSMAKGIPVRVKQIAFFLTVPFKELHSRTRSIKLHVKVTTS